MFYAKNFLKMDKTDLLLNAINNPEKYSSAELKELYQNDELKEIFDLLDKTKSSLQSIPRPDIDEEWTRFKNNHNLQKGKKSYLKFSPFFSRKIAASILIAIISLTTVAAIVGVSVSSLNNKENESRENELIATKDVIINQTDTLNTQSESSVQSLGTVIFDNEPLDVIMKQIGDFYCYKIDFKNNSIKSLRLYFRWNKASTIQEIAESLNNFEQIHLTIEGETIKID